MKRIVIIYYIIISSISGTCQNVQLLTPNDSLQYSMGVFVGQWVADNGFTINNLNLFNQGMADLILDNPRAVPDSTVVPMINSYKLSIQSQRNVQLEQQMFENLKGQSGVGVLPNGVHYFMIKEGSGARPASTDSIKINVVGVFPDGTLFENTFEKGAPIKATPGNLIPGLNAAVQLMPEGAAWRIFIPSALGYGETGLQNVIPPNTALVFEVTLEEVIRQ